MRNRAGLGGLIALVAAFAGVIFYLMTRTKKAASPGQVAGARPAVPTATISAVGTSILGSAAKDATGWLAGLFGNTVSTPPPSAPQSLVGVLPGVTGNTSVLDSLTRVSSPPPNPYVLTQLPPSLTTPFGTAPVLAANPDPLGLNALTSSALTPPVFSPDGTASFSVVPQNSSDPNADALNEFLL